MYTQCPDCATVFRVTADALRAAHGDVRCGVCSTSFNALDDLSEEPFKHAPAAEESAAPDDTITVVELPGTEVIELSSPVAAEQQAMEFNASAEELEQSFVEAPAVDPGSIAARLSVRESDQDPTDEYPILVLDERDALDVPAARVPDPRKPPAEPYAAPRILIPDAMRQDLTDAALAEAAAARVFEEPRGRDSPRRWPWAAGAAALALLLVAQIVHRESDALLRQPAIGPALAQAYALIGLPLAAPTDLRAYELRQWGAAADAAQPGRLLFRASIVNRAAYAQPYPLLRLILQDRFGSNIRARDIEPPDYLPGAASAGMLSPGQRADAEIRIVDPGREAIGFEMDVCLPAAGGVRCANSASPDAL